jgi:hypothetical protein
MPTTLPNGSTIYRIPDIVQDVLFNDESVMDLQLIEVKVEPSGHGYIMCFRSLEDRESEPKRMVDTQILTRVYYGKVQVIE